MGKLVYGVGINNADYAVLTIANGKQTHCQFYASWKRMLERCYDTKHHTKHPTYIGCTACNEWLTFSNFKAWMEKQDWHGKQLDKDLLVKGNKHYSPDACAFIDGTVNRFIIDSGTIRGEWPLGVSLHRKSSKYHANCRNPFTKNKEYLGSFNCPNQAHQAWRKRKHELACQLADLQTDERVANALRTRYA